VPAGPRGDHGRRLLLRRAGRPGRPRGRPVEAAAAFDARVAWRIRGAKRPCLVFAVLAFEARSTSFYGANLPVGDVVAGPAGQEKLPALAALGFRPVLGRTQVTHGTHLGRGRGLRRDGRRRRVARALVLEGIVLFHCQRAVVLGRGQVPPRDLGHQLRVVDGL